VTLLWAPLLVLLLLVPALIALYLVVRDAAGLYALAIGFGVAYGSSRATGRVKSCVTSAAPPVTAPPT